MALGLAFVGPSAWSAITDISIELNRDKINVENCKPEPGSAYKVLAPRSCRNGKDRYEDLCLIKLNCKVDGTEYFASGICGSDGMASDCNLDKDAAVKCVLQEDKIAVEQSTAQVDSSPQNTSAPAPAAPSAPPEPSAPPAAESGAQPPASDADDPFENVELPVENQNPPTNGTSAP